MPLTVGLDYGERRIGVAVSDPGGTIAMPRGVIENTGARNAVAAVEEVCRETGAEELVVGMPVNLDGSMGPAAQKVLAFSKRLEERLNIPVHTWDERLTTKSAEAVLIEAGTRRDRRKQVIDKLAAQIMLQHYLDAKGPDEMDPEDFEPSG